MPCEVDGTSVECQPLDTPEGWEIALSFYDDTLKHIREHGSLGLAAGDRTKLAVWDSVYNLARRALGSDADTVWTNEYSLPTITGGSEVISSILAQWHGTADNGVPWVGTMGVTERAGDSLVYSWSLLLCFPTIKSSDFRVLNSPACAEALSSRSEK
jgi:hypothetical protein